jgi:hypothetical protein
METAEKQVRFLYPPLILIASLALGVFLDPNCKYHNVIGMEITKNWVSLIFGTTLILFVAGYIIGTLTITILRILFIGKNGVYELPSKSSDVIRSLNKKLLYKRRFIAKEEELYAYATFDHATIEKDTHSWIQRRWSAFHTASNSATSLVISLIIGTLCLDIKFTVFWLLTVLIFFYIFILASYKARKETIEMINFQVRIKKQFRKQRPEH